MFGEPEYDGSIPQDERTTAFCPYMVDDLTVSSATKLLFAFSLFAVIQYIATLSNPSQALTALVLQSAPQQPYSVSVRLDNIVASTDLGLPWR
jgi:hypothetical protein